MTAEDYLLFLDLETTGNDAERDHVLECGYVLVERASLDEVGHGSSLILAPAPVSMLIRDPFVVDMHTKNGLIVSHGDAISLPLSTYLNNLFASMVVQGSADLTPCITLAGYSPNFDRQFIVRDAPHFARFLHHRMMDISSLRACAKVWAPHLVKEQEVAHRALADCYAAIEELKTYKAVFLETACEKPCS